MQNSPFKNFDRNLVFATACATGGAWVSMHALLSATPVGMDWARFLSLALAQCTALGFGAWVFHIAHRSTSSTSSRQGSTLFPPRESFFPPPSLPSFQAKSLLILLASLAAGLSAQFIASDFVAFFARALPGQGPSIEWVQTMHRLTNPRLAPAFFALLFSTVIAAPISEELFFRELIFGSWRAKHRFWSAAWVSALFFALFHGQPWAMIYSLPAGILLAFFRERTDRLWPCLLVHAAFNATPALLHPELMRIPGLNDAMLAPLSTIYRVASLSLLIVSIAMVAHATKNKDPDPAI